MNLTASIKTFLWIGLFGWLLTACSTLPPAEQSPRSTAFQNSEVYLLRGLFNVFSLGMDRINEQLHERGVTAGVYPGPSWPLLAQQIVELREQRAEEGLLIISGHSYGADDSVRLARALDKQGISVDALVLVDPTTPPKIPGNVALCVNIYRSRPTTDWMPWLRGIPVEREDPSTLVVNRDLRGSSVHPELAEQINHFNIDEHPAIREMVVNEILQILNEGGIKTARSSSGAGTPRL